jgi:hypothetical protein
MIPGALLVWLHAATSQQFASATAIARAGFLAHWGSDPFQGLTLDDWRAKFERYAAEVPPAFAAPGDLAVTEVEAYLVVRDPTTGALVIATHGARDTVRLDPVPPGFTVLRLIPQQFT